MGFLRANSAPGQCEPCWPPVLALPFVPAEPEQLPKRPPGNLAKGGPQLLHPPKKAQGQGQPTKRLWQLQELDPFLPVLEKVLLYSHLVLSLFFFTVISVKWSS